LKKIIFLLSIVACGNPADLEDSSPLSDIKPYLCTEHYMSDSIPLFINQGVPTVTNADFHDPRELLEEENDWYNEVLNCFVNLGVISDIQADCMSLRKPRIIVANGECIMGEKPRINCTQYHSSDCRFVVNTGCVRREFIILEQTRYESDFGEALFKHEVTHWIQGHLTGTQGHPEPWFFLDGFLDGMRRNDYDSFCGSEQCTSC